MLNLFSRRRGVSSAAELREFLLAEAAMLSQGSSFGYCQARAGLGWYKLIGEPAFIAALDSCRWQAFAAVLADMVLVTEALLRQSVRGERQRLGIALSEMLQDVLLSSPAPPEMRAALAEVSAAFPARMARCQLAEPHDPADIARTSGERLFELLPIHPTLREHDRDAVINGVRFGMVVFWEKLCRSVARPDELAVQLAAEAGSGEAP